MGSRLPQGIYDLDEHQTETSRLCRLRLAHKNYLGTLRLGHWLNKAGSADNIQMQQHGLFLSPRVYSSYSEGRQAKDSASCANLPFT